MIAAVKVQPALSEAGLSDRAATFALARRLCLDVPQEARNAPLAPLVHIDLGGGMRLTRNPSRPEGAKQQR